jgi:hypothetical protein
LERTKDHEVLEYVDIIGRSAKTLLSLISTLLDMIKLENGMFSMISEEFDLSRTVSECLDICAVNAHQKGIELYYVRKKACVEQLLGDERIIRQVLLNLMDNAIKFTESGHVRLEVWTEQSTSIAGSIDVMLRVEDTGIGIAADDLGRIFERFVQLDAGIKRKAGGSGLGLAIVRGFIELVQGDIDVHSEPGRGTVFTIRMPMRASDRRPSSRGETSKQFAFVGFPPMAESDLAELASPARVRVVGIHEAPDRLPECSVVVYADDAIADALYPDGDPTGTMIDLQAVLSKHEVVVATHLGSNRSKEIVARQIPAKFVTLPIREAFFRSFATTEAETSEPTVPRRTAFDEVSIPVEFARTHERLLKELRDLAQKEDEVTLERKLKEAGDTLERNGDAHSAKFVFMLLLEFRKSDAASLLRFLDTKCLPPRC